MRIAVVLNFLPVRISNSGTSLSRIRGNVCSNVSNSSGLVLLGAFSSTFFTFLKSTIPIIPHLPHVLTREEVHTADVCASTFISVDAQTVGMVVWTKDSGRTVLDESAHEVVQRPRNLDDIVQGNFRSSGQYRHGKDRGGMA